MAYILLPSKLYAILVAGKGLVIKLADEEVDDKEVHLRHRPEGNLLLLGQDFTAFSISQF